MSSNQPKVLGDYFTLQRGTTYQSKLLDQPGPVLLGLGTIQRNGGFRSDSLRTYGGNSPDKLLVQPGELYVSLKDVTQSADLLGAVARLPRDHAPGRLTQDTVKLEPKDADVPIDYLHWVMRTPEYRSYCKGRATGTTNLGLSREDFLSFPANAPSETQSLLVATLDSLDDKIELNRRMNETLEATARAVFKSWFVDFDPVRAKVSGEPPESICRRLGLTPDVLALFPDSFQDSELGEIPQGWRVGRLDDLCYLKRGHDLPASARLPGDVPVVSSSGVSGKHTEARAFGPGVITGRYGTIGKVFYIEEDYWPLNTTLYVEDFKESPPRFVFHVLEQVDYSNYTDKAAVPGVNRNHLHMEPTSIPPPSVRQSFTHMVAALWSKHAANARQSCVLATLRDAWLPRLVSGELLMTQGNH